MFVAHESDCRVYHLPGRDWFYLIGPDNSDTQNLTFGLAEFPAGSQPAAHTHDLQEEIIFILSGQGRFITPEREEALTPGTAVFIPPGLEHRLAVEGDEPLKLVTVFSPPVTPGAYDPKRA
ncbi:MAG TPA: cupin domain-containing protein [Anaerolineae bacterium]|nr:cupin domain-containing protein [Anaerolineae bacterium]